MRGFVALALLASACASAKPNPAPCLDARFQLREQRSNGVLRRLYLPVALDGQRGELFVDTGSARTFVIADAAEDAWLPPSGSLELGCHRFTPLRRGLTAEHRRPGSALGTFGAESMLATATVLDLARAELRFEQDAPVAAGAIVLPLEIVKGIAITRLVVDGVERRLMFDTGTADLLLLDAPPPGAPLHEVHDAFGAPIQFAEGVSAIRWPDGTERFVPVWKTEHHPAFERHRAQLGVPLDGLLGLSAFEDATIVLHPAAGVIEVRRAMR